MPGAIPVKIPVLPMVATDVDPLLQVPPATLLPNGVLKPTHTEADPLIADGVINTVTALVTAHDPNV